MVNRRSFAFSALVLAALCVRASAAAPAAWTTPHAPFRIAEGTWYVGTAGISVLLLRGDAGSILIDTGAPGGADALIANLDAVGVQPGEIKAIVTSHAHLDHTGSLARLKEHTGGEVYALAASADLLAAGGANDLHFGNDLRYAPVTADRRIADGDYVTVGTLSVRAHHTPAHTPGSTTWTWSDRIDGQTVAMVYADSLTAPGYRLVDNPRAPDIVADFRRGFDTIRALDCDVLITPHPEASDLFARAESKTLVDASACKRYADRAEAKLDAQIAEETAGAAQD